MMIERCTVVLSFRFDSGSTMPSNKSIRARVLYQGAYGEDLVNPVSNDIFRVQAACAKKLRGKVKIIEYSYSPMIQQWVNNGGKRAAR